MGGILAIVDRCQRFSGEFLSPTALNIMRDNLVAQAEAARLGGYVFTSHYGQWPEENDEQNQVIYRGGGVFRTGVTTLRIVTHTIGTVVAGDILRIYRGDNDASGNLPATYNDVSLAAGTQTHTVGLSGYSDGTPIRVQIEVRHAADPNPPYTGVRVHVVLAELTPITLPDAAPTLPTFTSVADLTSLKMNQLATYVDWITRRMGTRYDPLFIVQIRRGGPFCIPGVGTDPNVAWYGGVRTSPLHTALTVKGYMFRVWGGATESIRLSINGTVVAAFTVPTTLGETAWSIPFDLSGYANDTVLRLKVDYVRTAPALDDQPVNRWTVSEVSVSPGSGGAETLAEWGVRQSGVSDAALLAWVQAARNLAATITARISANPAFWAHQRLFTARPAASAGKDLSQFSQFEEWSIPGTWRRAGDAIEGRGRALKLGYGANYLDEAAYKRAQDAGSGVGAWPLLHTRDTAVLDGDNVDSFRFFLDDAEGLSPGSPFFVRGIESYVLMERLKVVEG